MSAFRTRRTPLIYSEDFRKAVLKAYPTHEVIKKLLDENEYFLGGYLDDCSNGCIESIPFETIIGYLEHDAASQLLTLAKEKSIEAEKLRFRVKVYNMWDKEVFLDWKL